MIVWYQAYQARVWERVLIWQGLPSDSTCVLKAQPGKLDIKRREPVGVCDCSMFCCALLCVHFSIAIILMGKRELIALLNLSSWCLVVVGRLFLTVPRGCLQFVIVVFPDHTHLLFLVFYLSVNPLFHSQSSDYYVFFCFCVDSVS